MSVMSYLMNRVHPPHVSVAKRSGNVWRMSAVLFGAVFCAAAACASSLDTLETFLKSTKSGRADFTQVVTPPAKAGQTTVRSKTSTGQFSFVRPTRFRFDYVKPFPQVIVALSLIHI